VTRITAFTVYKKKVKQSVGFQEVEAPRISRQSAHEDGKVVSPTHRPRLPLRKYSWYSFLLEAESTPGP
jgi:hypothetical protein